MSTLFAKKATRKHKNKSKDSSEVVGIGDDDTSSKKRQRTTTTTDDVSSSNHTKVHDGGVPTAADPSSLLSSSSYMTFDDFNGLLAEPLIETCRALGYTKPTPVQQTMIPFLLHNRSSNVLALAATGTGKTAAFVLPILHHLSIDPYGIYAVIVSPTRELASQIHQQVLALGSRFAVRSCLVIGGMDPTKQSTQLDAKPHIVVATPGRLAELLRGPYPPHLANVRYLVLDEADRLLSTEGNGNSSNNNGSSGYATCGFERDVAELILHCNNSKSSKNSKNNKGRRQHGSCQTLLFSATMTRSLESLQEIAGVGDAAATANTGSTTSSNHTAPLKKFVIRPTNEGTDSDKFGGDKSSLDEDGHGHHDNDNDSGSNNNGVTTSSSETTTSSSSLLPSLPAGLRQEYIFMPSRVRDAYLLATIRTLVVSNGRGQHGKSSTTTRNSSHSQQHHHHHRRRNAYDNSIKNDYVNNDGDDDDIDGGNDDTKKARSVIVFVSTCQRCALVSELLAQVGVDNVALHSLLSQNRRLASLAKFKSHHVRVCVATDLASRGLDIPTVDLVINAELPRNPVSYVHRIGRTARAGRRGRAINLISENDVALVHAAESTTGKPMDKCKDITDDVAIQLLGSVTKAARLAKIKLADIGFDELVKKAAARKLAEKKERRRIERALKRQKR